MTESNLDTPDLSHGHGGTEGGVRRPGWRSDLWLLLAIAGPNVATTIAQSLMGFVDFTIVSQMPNATEAQAAVTCGNMVFFTTFMPLLGTMMCVTTMVSQSLGAGRYRDCSAYGWQGIWASGFCGVAVLLLYPFLPRLFGLIGHDLTVQAMEVDYTRIRIFSIGFAGSGVAMANFFNGIHRPAVTTWSVIVTNVINGVVSYGLVLGKWGLPEMGVAGAAWGSVIATASRTVWLMAAMCFGRASARYDALHTWRYSREKMSRLLRIGWPTGAANTVDVAAWAVFLLLLIGSFGEEHLAATATVYQFLNLAVMPAFGIGMSISTLVGRAIGQGDNDHARRLARVGGATNVSYMFLTAIVYVAAGERLIMIFNDTPAVVVIGGELLLFAALRQFFDGFAIAYSAALRGAGDTRWPSAVAAFEAWTIMVIGGALVVCVKPEWTSKGPWIGSVGFIMIVSLTLYIRWWWGKWEELDVIGRLSPDEEVGIDASHVETILTEHHEPDEAATTAPIAAEYAPDRE